MPITRLVKFPDLIEYLNETSLPHQADLEQQAINIPVNSPPLQGQIVIRWEKKLPYVQIIQPMVTDVPPERRAEVEQAICRSNNAIPLPGFGYAYDRNFVYMRLCVPMYEEGMLAESFRKQVMSVISNARQFLVPFRKVVAGEPGERIVDLAVAEAAAAS